MGGGFMRALRARHPEVHFVGIGGPSMLAQGLESLAPLDALSVNGFRDPLLRLPALFRLLRQLERDFTAAPIDAFLGVDFNVFNLLLERRLKKLGFPTAHYVSPSVYAWRRGRTRTIARAARLLLTLYPFEPAFYETVPLDVVYVGHPLADAIAPDAGNATARQTAREALGVGPTDRCLAMLPGSRRSELDHHLPLFLAAAEKVSAELGAVTWVLPCPRPALRPQVEAALETRPGLEVLIDDGTARRALTAAEGALIKSGTSTLEAMLLRRPMAVAYRLGPMTHRALKRIVHAPYFALPNILAGRALVPELIQDAATPTALAEALLSELSASIEPNYFASFDELHTLLRRDADQQAATAVLHYLLDRSAR